MYLHFPRLFRLFQIPSNSICRESPTIVFLFLFSDCILQVRDIELILYADLVFCNLAVLIVSSSSLLVYNLRFSLDNIISSVIRNSFTSFPVWMLFLSFFLLPNCNVEDIPVLFLTLGGNHQSSTIDYGVSCGFFIGVLFPVEEVSCYSQFLVSIMKRILNFVA